MRRKRIRTEYNIDWIEGEEIRSLLNGRVLYGEGILIGNKKRKESAETRESTTVSIPLYEKKKMKKH